MCKMTPISVRLNLKNFILISCAVMELLRKVSLGGGRNPPPPGEIRLIAYIIDPNKYFSGYDLKKQTKVRVCLKTCDLDGTFSL